MERGKQASQHAQKLTEVGKIISKIKGSSLLLILMDLHIFECDGMAQGEK